METMSLRQLRERLGPSSGVSVSEFAEAAGLQQTSLSAILGGRLYLGPVRRARIEAAIARFRLDAEPTPMEAERLARVEKPILRIRSL